MQLIAHMLLQNCNHVGRTVLVVRESQCIKGANYVCGRVCPEFFGVGHDLCGLGKFGPNQLPVIGAKCSLTERTAANFNRFLDKLDRERPAAICNVIKVGWGYADCACKLNPRHAPAGKVLIKVHAESVANATALSIAFSSTSFDIVRRWH